MGVLPGGNTDLQFGNGGNKPLQDSTTQLGTTKSGYKEKLQAFRTDDPAVDLERLD